MRNKRINRKFAKRRQTNTKDSSGIGLKDSSCFKKKGQFNKKSFYGQQLKMTIVQKKEPKKKKTSSISGVNANVPESDVIFNKVVNIRFVNRTRTKAFIQTDTSHCRVHNEVREEQASIALSNSDTAKSKQRRDSQSNILPVSNVENIVEYRGEGMSCEDAGPGNNHSKQNDTVESQSPSHASKQQVLSCESKTNAVGINTAVHKYSQYATEIARNESFNSWPDSASHTPEILADAGFFYAGFGDCVRCFCCGIGLCHWSTEDDPWIEHARWSKTCVFVKQKKGEEFVNLVQLAVQYSQDKESNPSESQLQSQEIESVLEMGYQPRIIKKSMEEIHKQNTNTKITAQLLMEKILEIEESENRPQDIPQTPVRRITSPRPTTAATRPAATQMKAGTAHAEILKHEENVNPSAKCLAENKPEKSEKAKENKSKGTLEVSKTVLPYNGPEEDERLIIQLHKNQQDETIESQVKDDTDRTSSLIQADVLCLPHSETEESMEQLKITDCDIDEESLEPTEIKDKFVETTEEIKSKLHEIQIAIKDSPGLRMISPQMKINTIRKMLQMYFDCKQYQKIIFNPVHITPEKLINYVCPVRYNGHLLVIPWCMMNEVSRVLSLRHADIHTEHPIILRLARDGYFSDESGIVSCVFCGNMIQNYLLLSQSHYNDLITQLNIHCNRCMERRNNIQFQDYGSHVNLAAVMARTNMQLIHIEPSGCLRHTNGERFHCEIARWIHENMQVIVPSGSHFCLELTGSLPQPASLFAVDPPVPCHNAEPSSIAQSVPNTSTNHLQSSGRHDTAVSSAYVICTSEAISLPERESQQQMVIEAELPIEILGQDDRHVDVERQLPEATDDFNADHIGKTRTSRADDLVTFYEDYGTGAEAATGMMVPEMADIDNRISSFNQCQHRFKQTPQAFAKACFFYTGVGDKVQCAVCNGCLEQWEEMDNPFLEHARNFPQCQFIWNFVIDFQMRNDPLLPHVIQAYVMSRAGMAAQEDGYSQSRVYEAVESLIISREMVTYANIVAKLRDMSA